MEKTDAVMLLPRGNSIIIDKAGALGRPIVTVIHVRDDGQTTDDDDDLTNAVLNCTTDCLMLSTGSDEEAHPDTALQRISSLCKELENSIDYKDVHLKLKETLPKPVLPFERRATYASWNSEKMQAKAIIIIAKSAIKLVAKCRPSVPVLSVVRSSTYSERSSDVASRGLLSRGVIPLMGAGSKIEDMISFAVQFAKKEGICNAGDKVVALRILNGYPALLTLRAP
ncbi:unnamed protein product [Eruca vesicaria subsp. sativa]|uniref:Pyruvate kinase C-terminal domain-containing protein n=1 Tax=Eruca vesicaria subsp. sativa TaxID=29727 RepID=A0ABC8M5B4_ERUVS|nr:unnamed protein product [Eruca vesicaria subsp. sativa]